MQCTMTQRQSDALVEQLQARMKTLLGTYVAQVRETPMEQVEAQVQQVSQQMAQAILQQTVQALNPPYPAVTQPCPCGQAACYQRQRTATVRSVVGPITYRRAYYLCPTCHHGAAPLDQALGWCAGGLSASLQQRVALLGAHLPYAQARQVLADLTLVTLSAPTIRRATLQVGRQVDQRTPAPAVPLNPLYVSADGCMVLLRQEGWKEVRVGCVYTSQPHDTKQGLVPHAEQPHYVAGIGDLATFGAHLWQTSVRCGVEQAPQVVVIGDGAAWIDGLAQTYWPQAWRIVDWYHALHYLRAAADALPTSVDAATWFADQETALWAGRVNAVLDALHAWTWTEAAAVIQAETYVVRHRAAMQYAHYRAQGLQMGSGPIESACKQVVQARCKGAGMRWSRAGIQPLLAVRSCCLSDEWQVTCPLLTPPARSYHRKAA